MDVFFKHPLRKACLFFLLSFHLHVFYETFWGIALEKAERNTKTCKKIL